MTKNKENLTGIENLKKLLDKKYGDGSIIIGRESMASIESFPTDIVSLDLALGVNGLPVGRIIEIYGAESSGKTTTCLQIMAACQKHMFDGKPGVVAFIDAEHALDIEWAEKIGVDVDKLILSQPNSGEEAFDIVETMVKSGLVNLIVVDSVAALTPQKIIEGEMDDNFIGTQAQLMSKGLSKIKSICNTKKCTIIFVNQIRMKIGVMFGSPETTPGGRALKFYASVRAEIRRGENIKNGEKSIGTTVKAKITKNKVAPPFTSAEYVISFGNDDREVYGIDKVTSIFTAALEMKIITLSGSQYKYDGTLLGNGKVNAIKAISSNQDLYNEIKNKIYNNKPVLVPSALDFDSDETETYSPKEDDDE